MFNYQNGDVYVLPTKTLCLNRSVPSKILSKLQNMIELVYPESSMVPEN